MQLNKEKVFQKNPSSFTHFRLGFFCAFLFLVLFLSNPAFAFALQEKNSTQSEVAFFADIIDTTTDTNNYSSSGAYPTSCRVSILDPKEAKDIIDLTQNNFSGGEMTDGSDANVPGKKIDDLELVGETGDGNKAIKVAPPNETTSPDRFKFFNGKRITGPWGVGLVLDDTLRVGRCESISQESCRINGNGLNYRTDGKGFISDISSAFTSLSDASGRISAGVSDEEYKKMQNNLLDDNSTEMIVATSVDGEMIPNSIKSRDFTAQNATTCNGSKCLISTYSAFDKYYNAWFSTDFVVSNFGPLLVSRAGRLLHKAAWGVGRDDGTVLSKLSRKLEGIRSNIVGTPTEAIGISRISQYHALLNEYGLRNYLGEGDIGMKWFSSGSAGYAQNLLDMAPNGKSILKNLSADQKKAYYKAVEHLRAYAEASKAQVDAAKATYNAVSAGGDIAELAARRNFAKTMAAQVVDWDTSVDLDFIKWLQQQNDFFDYQGYAIQRLGATGTDEMIPLTATAPNNLKRVIKEFSESPNGDWSKWAQTPSTPGGFKALDNGSLKMFKLSEGSVFQKNVSIDDLEKHLAKYGADRYSVQLPGQKAILLNAQSIDYLKKSPSVPGTIDILKTDWVEVPEGLTPDDFARRLTDIRITGRPNVATKDLGELVQGLRQYPEFSTRRTYGWLDAQFAKEKDLIFDYYKAKPAALATATFLPVAVWNVKRGLGSEDFSAYMLPDTWTTIKVSTGVGEIYRDAFIDFYANAGSDQGDMFGRAINSFVFAYGELAEVAISQLSPAFEDYIDRATGEGGLQAGITKPSIMRDEVKDIAFYSHNENCSGCTTPIIVKDNYFKVSGFVAPTEMKGFIVEALSTEQKKEDGTTIVSYAHHTNIEGKTTEVDGEKISLVQARTDEMTCDQRLRAIGLGWAGTGAGGILALGESATYFIFGPAGLIASGVQQLLLAPKLQDCVDDVEGYYIHFYSPPQLEKNKAATKETLSSQSINDAIAEMAKKTDEAVAKEANNPVSNAVESLSKDVKDFAEQAKNIEILQASIELFAPNQGTLSGSDVFYFWYKGNSMPAGYPTEGVLEVKDGNQSVKYDLENGELIINGKKVLGSDKADHVRMTTLPGDFRIPAQVIPVTLTSVAMPRTNDPVFELDTYGQIRVLDNAVRDCISNAIFDQSGIQDTGDELTRVFGPLTGIATESYGTVFTRDGVIYLEGLGPRTQSTSFNSVFIINGFWEGKLLDAGRDLNAGKLVSMTFENGTIVLKPETQELIIWLRQHHNAVLNNSDVVGLRGNLTSTIDPETECPVPAINLEALANPASEKAGTKVANFNTSMEHLGPFTQFTTDKRIYIFYSKRDENSGGECKDYFKVIDKDTGQVLTDSEIVGGVAGVKQSDDGTISFQTVDGQNHTLKFDAENGVPKLSYNGGVPETLLSAQGTKGSFWYDPATGQWYPENGLQIPLNPNYKENGGYFSTEGGKFSGQSGNPITFNVGDSKSGGFNIPSLPENIFLLACFIAMFLVVAFTSTQFVSKSSKKKLKRK